MHQCSTVNHRRFHRLALGVALGLPLIASASPQYTVGGSNGAIGFTDRQPVSASGRVEPSSLGTTVSQLTAIASLPLELRQTVSRYPVTLYGQNNCDACNTGRQLLRQRGIPFNEKQVNDGDGEALERVTGGRQLPVLTIGSQVLRGYSANQWTSYLDAAGYPKQSRLPSGYVSPAPTPLVAAPASSVPAIAAPVPPPPAVAPPPSPSGIRF